jgi:hypothetical protein
VLINQESLAVPESLSWIVIVKTYLIMISVIIDARLRFDMALLVASLDMAVDNR